MEKYAHLPEIVSEKVGATETPSHGGTLLHAYTLAHVAISLVAIAAGLVVLFGMLAANPLEGWTAVFLWTTIATSVTGFFFPFNGFKPSYVVGILSLILLALAYQAYYRYQLAGHWRWIYVVSAAAALYFNVFVLVVQTFQKVPALQKWAPTQSEPPFKKTQLAVFVAFIALGAAAVMKFRP